LLAIGADGARGGWLAVACQAPSLDAPPTQRRTEIRLLATIDELAAWRATAPAAPSALPVGVDMPIGLPDWGGQRRCEPHARRLLQHRASTIFPAPPRALITAATYPEARARVADRRRTHPGTRSISAQAFALAPKIRELDAHLTRDPPARDWLYEVHPELSFRALAGGQPQPPKQRVEGGEARVRLLREPFPDLLKVISDTPIPPRLAKPDDILDAYACLWSALRIARGEAVQLGGEPDTLGLPMRIVY
jgi:predicted RNase H-like nuclease